MGVLLQLINNIDNDWHPFLKKESQEPYFLKLDESVTIAYQKHICYPPLEKIFQVFTSCQVKDIKVVIIGQDPYHEEGEANGIAFSVNREVKMPPSLKNIFKLLKIDLGIDNRNPDLSSWVKNGVFLLNRILTVEEGKPLSHQDYGWLIFTSHVISYLNQLEQPICFVLWGNSAISLKELITNQNKEIIESTHPSPLSAYRGFFDSKSFIKINNFIEKYQLEPVNWSTDEKGNENEKNN